MTSQTKVRRSNHYTIELCGNFGIEKKNLLRYDLATQFILDLNLLTYSVLSTQRKLESFNSGNV
jgi:hypothetical protein